MGPHLGPSLELELFSTVLYLILKDRKWKQVMMIGLCG